MRRRPIVMVVVGAGLGAGALFLWQHEREESRARESRTVIEAMRRVTRLATVEMTVSDWRLREDEKSLFGMLPIKCRKTVAVFYRGTVAAGFDLDTTDGTSLTIDGARRRVAVHLPAARLLYVDAPPPDLVVADGSLCNEVTPDDYGRLAKDARQAIERQAIKSGILKRAEANARTLLGEVARPLGYEVEATFAGRSLSQVVAERR